MKRLWVCIFLLLVGFRGSRAQDNVPKPLCDTGNAAPDFSATSAAKVTFPDFLSVTDSFTQPAANAAHAPASMLDTALLAEPAPADPAAPSPKPRFVYGGRDDYRLQLSVGAAWFRFHSSVFNANAVGIQTTVTYFLNEWLGVEGSVTAAWGAPINQGQDVKIAVYGGGPKIAWRQKRWEPWVHALFGGAHEEPQTASAGRNSYSIMTGGGADYRQNPHVSFRVEADYVHTHFFSQSQNNFELSGGIVFHF
jgi:hypothetical protein